jgi:large subunit ribosomal protein L19
MDVSSLIEMKRNPKIPELSPGDTVKVSARIVEGGKERIQVFQGVVIKIRRGGASANFTVRHVAFGIGVERTFPMYSPLVEKVEIVRHGKVRRSKLYYLRGLSGKEARRKIKRVEKKVKGISEELIAEEPEEVLEPEDIVQEGTEEAVEEQQPIAAEQTAGVETVQEKPAAEGAEGVIEEEAKAEEPEAPQAVEEETGPEAATEDAETEAEPEPEEAEEKKVVAETPEAGPVMEKEEEEPADDIKQEE